MLRYLNNKILPHILFGLSILALSAVCSAKSIHDLKAAYLYNFIKFISWPTELTDETEFRLCLLGEDPGNDKFKLLEQRPIHGRSLHVKTISTLSPSDQCTVLFIGTSEEKFLSDIITELGESPTLTVSSIPNFAVQGGTIGFVTLGNVIRFDINLGKATHNQLTISSKLLELANQVVK